MENELKAVFSRQQEHKFLLRERNAGDRVLVLKRLKSVIEKYEDALYAALQHDLGKSRFESAVTELIFTYAELDFAIKNIKHWMKPKRIGRTWTNFFARNRLYYEPRGVCLILAPWNYPFQLVMGPIISAIAAGNCVIVKPSELSPATSKIIHALLAEAFEENEVACFEGDAGLANALLQLPFDHIFFTGSTAVGKLVMTAAAKNLSSVTLELGGKSPSLIDRDVDLEDAATKIAWGKLVNCGQTCIAPDYVLIPKDLQDRFTGFYKAAVHRLFYKNDALNSHSYGKIINSRHFSRIKGMVDEALIKGAKINLGGTFDEKTQVIPPVVLTQVPDNASIMEEEIFGPVLPLISYETLDEALDHINRKSKPLALYIFSKNSSTIKKVLKNTSAGGTCINDVLVHISNPKLPFGGVNTSGMGSSHGFYGFKAFSHERAVVFQSAINVTKLVYPPYQGKEWVLNLLKKIM